MFLSHTAERPLFAPSDYSDAETFVSEQKTVFARSWNVVAAEKDLARHGAQLGVEVGGLPVVVRNERGTLRAFRNVCPHRHSQLVKPGHSCADTFKCQYHGWEFAADGALSLLPDGRSFVGWKAKGTQLLPVRCETAFGLVFVNVSEGTTTLAAEWAGIYPELSSHFSGMALQWIQLSEHDVNWKIVVENGVESYHVPMVHPETFVTYQDERFHGHVIEPAYTQYHDLKSSIPLSHLALDMLMFPRQRSYGYSHTHLHPNHLVTYAGFYREWVMVEPLGPSRCRRVGYGFLPSEVRTEFPARMFVRELARRTRFGADRILGEDSSVWPSVQRGSEASPFRGVLSVREERVTAFQRWVMERRAAG
jgi:phenylpropionate dioxygenase-like ring-hydroxylating dioxygenase large terminal subunit